MMYFVTSNAEKAKFAALNSGISIETVKIDLPEIQSLCLKEIAGHKVKAAAQFLQKQKPPVVSCTAHSQASGLFVEDMSLEFSALGRLPGTLIKWFESELGLDGLCRLLNGKPRSATVRCVIAHMSICQINKKEPVIHYIESAVTGSIAEKPKGTGGFGWDKIFMLEGLNGKTNAELPQGLYNEQYFKKIRRYDLLTMHN